MKTILAPVDFSRVTRRVVKEALDLARAIDGRVVLFHSVPPSPIIADDLLPLVGSTLLVTDDVQRAASRHLRRMQQDLKRRGVPVETVCTSGIPVTQIIACARKVAASYIVIGSHGHTAFYDLVVGSTASGVLKHANGPVVVVPAQTKGKPRRSRRA